MYTLVPLVRSTDRLFIPNIVLYYSLRPLILRAHILACSHRCNCIGQRPWLLGVCNKALVDCMGALALACFGKLYRGHYKRSVSNFIGREYSPLETDPVDCQ